LTPTSMTLELTNRSVAYPVGVAEDVIVKVGKFHFPADFVVVDYDVDPRVPLILGRPFLRTSRALVDVFREELILRDEDEKLFFHADNSSKHPQKHANESINMISLIDITCEDRFPEVLKKLIHPSSGSTTPLSNSLPSLTPFKTSDSLLEEFVDELALHDLFPSRNEYDNFDPEADLRKIEYLLNREPSTESSPKSDIEIIDSILKRFTNEPAHVYSFPSGDDDDDNDDLFTTSLLVLPTVEPEDSFIMRDEDLYTIPEMELDEFIKSSVEDLVPIPRESKDTSDSDKDDVNPLFNEVLEDIENKDSYISNLNELVLLVTRLSDANKDECFDPGGDIDEIDADFKDDYYNSEGDIIYLKSLLIKDIISDLLPEVFLDHALKRLNDEPNIDDLKIKENVRITFEDRHYLSLTFVIKIFLPFLTYPVNSSLLLSSRSEDTIFDPGISVFNFYSLEPMAYESPMMIFPFFCFCPKDKGIRGEIAPDYKDSRARGFVHRSLKLHSLACLYMGIRYPRFY
ncbi:reverse transcriptase domain-containing protein, partial [Tanacetum coccineum]